MNRISSRTVAIAVSAFVCAAVLSFGWSEQDGISLSIDKAQAARLVVHPYHHYYSDYYDVTTEHGVPWYAVRAYYNGGPWYNYSGWDDYAARYGIGCHPGTLIKGGDGIMYVCQ
jgi:hypothetical protein